MRVRTYFIILLLLSVLSVAAPRAVANETPSPEIKQERMDLFVASQHMLQAERTPPNMRVGMLLTTLGDDPEVSLGVKVESNLGHDGKLRVVTETIYLKNENTLAGFLSLKFVKHLGHAMPSLYIGAGAGYAKGLRYQVFAGIEITKNFFADVRYINMPGGLGDKGLYLATGFQFTY